MKTRPCRHPHARRHPRKPGRANAAAAMRTVPGFTLVELLVAISIIATVVFLFSQVFLEAQAAVEIGRANSRAISESGAIADQLAKDAEAMLIFEDDITRPGATPGFLVIIQHRTPNRVELPDGAKPELEPDPGNPFPASDEDWNQDDPSRPDRGRFIRSDQLVFFVDASGQTALTPGAPERLEADTRANFARVWYGHLSRPRSDDTAEPLGDDPDTNAVPNAEGVNATTADLLLGRQVLYVVAGNETFPNASAADVGNLAIPEGGSWSTLANNIDLGWRSEVDGAASGSNVTELDPGGSVRALWQGGVDALYLGDIPSLGGSPGDGTWAALFDDLPGPLAVAADGDGSTDAFAVNAPGGPTDLEQISDGLVTRGYKAFALGFAFPRADERLLGQTDVDLGLIPGNPPTINSADVVAQVARLHAVLTPYVSDFIVEFAADMTDDIDTVSSPSGQILRRDEVAPLAFTGDGLPDGEPDRIQAGDAGLALGDPLVGTIRWYAGWQFANYPGMPATTPQPTGFRDDQPVVWPIPRFGNLYDTLYNGATYYSGATAASGLPTERVRTADPEPGKQYGYAVYPPAFQQVDAAFSFVGPQFADAVGLGSSVRNSHAFVFGHTGDDPATDELIEGHGKYWPYLIRIRYRLHDRDGDVVSIDPGSGQRISGQWREVIIPVRR